MFVSVMILKSGLILATVTLATDVKSNMDEEEDISVDNKNRHPSCSVQILEKMKIINCSGVPKFVEFLDNVDSDINIVDVSYTGLATLTTLNKAVLNSVSSIDASHNSVTYIEEGMFTMLKNLEKIDLSYNLINQLPDGAFMSLPYLSFLDLSKNKLTTIPNNLPILEWLDISNNEIEFIPEAYTSVLYPQTVFLLGLNPFRCSCDMLWLKDLIDTRRYLLKFRKHIDQEKFIPICISPQKLSGKSWDDLKDDDFGCAGHIDNNLHQSDGILTETADDIEVRVSDISYNSVVIQWNRLSVKADKMLGIKFHKFGETRDMKEVVIPLSASSYRIKNLHSETPYVVCFMVSLGKESQELGCEEIVTRKVPSSSHFTLLTEYFLQHIHITVQLHHWKTAMDLLKDEEERKKEEDNQIEA